MTIPDPEKLEKPADWLEDEVLHVKIITSSSHFKHFTVLYKQNF